MTQNIRHSSSSYKQIERQATLHNWLPGRSKHLPWQGIGALLGVLAGLATAVGILSGANEQRTSEWKLQPSVWLTVAYTITNLFLIMALREACTTAWWTTALCETGTVADLHFTWARGSSVWQALKGTTKFKFVAYACLAVSISPINGPIFQRALTVGQKTVSSAATLQIRIGSEMPTTGYLTGRNAQFAGLTSNFTLIYQDFSSKIPIPVMVTGCDDICTAVVTGPGLVANCSTSYAPFDLNPPELPDGSLNFSAPIWTTGFDIFTTNATVDTINRGTQDRRDVISLHAQFKNTSDCAGKFINNDCTLSLGVVRFPVIIDGKQNTIQLDPNTTISHDSVVTVDDNVDGQTFGPTHFSGLAFVLNTGFGSTMNMQFGGAVNYISNLVNGVTATRHVTIDASTSDAAYTNCSLSFTNPMDEMLAAARELVFRTTMAATESPTTQTVQAQQSGVVQVYITHGGFVAAGVIFTLLAWLLIIPNFRGYWKFGRKVSMSPIETAKAFAAPLLQQADPNSTAEEIVKTLGHKDVRYGVVAKAGDEHNMELMMDDPKRVRTPEPGEIFGIESAEMTKDITDVDTGYHR